ncbi:MAG: shikimate kinase [Saprospiraceae bacterium]|nr:shikimate kinase [Saprospiraceae bacterium]
MKQSKQPERVFLIGMMGSGKTTVAHALALQLGVHFVDLDEVIVRSAGMSIARIFEESGEAGFRRLERSALRSTVNLYDTVIATGGGAPCHWDGLAFMRQFGHTVYLRARVETLVRRIEQANGVRPLLGADPAASLKQLLAQRSTIYEAADHIVDVDNLNVDEVVRSISNYLSSS